VAGFSREEREGEKLLELPHATALQVAKWLRGRDLKPRPLAHDLRDYYFRECDRGDIHVRSQEMLDQEYAKVLNQLKTYSV